MKTLLEKLNGGDLIEIDFKYRCKCGVRGHAVQFVHPKSAPLRKAEAKAGHFQCSECDAKMFADQRPRRQSVLHRKRKAAPVSPTGILDMKTNTANLIITILSVITLAINIAAILY